MTFKEITEREDNNKDSIWLYREGMFLKAYEHSAFLVHTQIHQFKLSLRYIKTVNRDVISLGFPAETLNKWMYGYVVEQVSEVLYRCGSRTGFDEVAYHNWRECVKINEGDHFTPHTAVIEKAPIYKTTYDLLTQAFCLSANLSKNVSNPLGIRLKDYSYQLSYAVRVLYDVRDRKAHIDKALAYASELKFIYQILKDLKEISLKSYALASERLVSVSKQLSALRGKVTAEVHEV